jgi:preprotein translocase subunit SecE
LHAKIDMKKQSQRQKKKRPKKKISATKKTEGVNSNVKPLPKEMAQQKPVRTNSKKVSEKKVTGDRSIKKYVGKASQFFRDARMELKKVKWPTRKELLASTAVVIVLTLIIALFLGLVDFGLIKILKNVVG